MKIRIIAICLLTVLFIASCAENPIVNETSNIEEQSKIDITFEITDGGESFDDSSETVSEETLLPEEVYEFLGSEYVVVSRSESFGKIYVCEYYFLNGIISGAKLLTTLPDSDSANNYYEQVIKDYPDAKLDNLTVTHYLADDDLFYYGYSLEKLEFVLKKSGYEFELKFDRDEFFEQFSEVSEG